MFDKGPTISALGLLVCLAACSSEKAEQPTEVTSAQQLDGLTDAEFAELEASTGFQALKPPLDIGPFGTALLPPSSPKEIAEEAKQAFRKISLDRIDPEKHYQLILQIGHFPRKKGFTGTSGRRLSEQEAVALIVSKMKSGLDELGIEYVVIGADSYRKGPLRNPPRDGQHYMKTDVFLSLHLDGAKTPCNSAPSIGYNPKFGKKEMALLGAGLAIALELDARNFMRDNFTRNLSHFSSYKHSDSQIAEGIIEMSELTCKHQEERFLLSSNAIAANFVTAISFMLDMQNDADKIVRE